MPAERHNIFLLEVIAYRVLLTGPDEATNTCPVCVCFRFPGLVHLELCEGDFCNNGNRTARGGIITMSRGKSCLFAVSTHKLCRTAQRFCAAISVYRRVHGGPETRFVGHASMEFDKTFTNVIDDPDQPCRMREMKQMLPLYENGCSRRVGTVDVLVRLTSHGDLLVTEFYQNPGSDKYKYVGVDQYVPTNAAARKHCCEDEPPRRRKCCKNRPRKKTDEEIAEEIRLDREKRATQVLQAKCIVDLMRRMRELYVMVSNGETRLRPSTKASKRLAPCAIDPKCPVARCPFRVVEPPAQAKEMFSGVVGGGGGGGTAAAASARAEKKTVDEPKASDKEAAPENEAAPEKPVIAPIRLPDGPDLFSFAVGRVDPCRNYGPEPKTYRDCTTQYLVTDLPSGLRLDQKKKHKHDKSGKNSKKDTKKAKKKK